MGIKQFKKMKKTRYIALTLLMALLTVSCEKELPKTMKVDFTATMEQPTGDSKVQLVNEQWIYWERGDEISIGSNMSTAFGEPAAKAALTGNGIGDLGIQCRFHLLRPAGRLDKLRGIASLLHRQPHCLGWRE